MKHIIIITMLLSLMAPVFSAEIHTAIEKNDISSVQSLITENKELLHLKNENGLNPLNLAAFLGNSEIVSWLLKTGADIDEGDFENSKPLHNAAVSGDLETIRTLVKHGAQVDCRDDYNMTPLHFALNFQKNEAANFLIASGADVNARNNHGFLPLIYASIYNNTEMVKLLLNNNADPEKRGLNESTPLHYAATRGQTEYVSLYLEHGADPDITNSEGETPLFWCGREQSLPAAKLLIKNGADVLIRNNHGSTCLHNAVFQNAVAVTRFFVENGCPVNVMDDLGWTPLANASFGSPAVVEYLLLNGASPNWGFHGGSKKDLPVKPLSTALHGAVSRGQLEIVKTLITHHANINALDQFGMTPLHVAARENKVEIAEFLLENNALPRIQCQDFRRTALHIASINGHRDIVRLLLDRHIELDDKDTLNHTALDYAFYHNYRPIAYDLLAANADDGRLTELVQLNSDFETRPHSAIVHYLGHSGWAIETPEHMLIFDYNMHDADADNPVNSLANGNIVPEQLGDKPVTVFVTHAHGDHYHRDIFLWKHHRRDIQYVFGFRPGDIPRNEYRFIPHRTTETVGDITVTTLLSNDTGVGFLVEVDGMTIFHAGDHAWGVKSEKQMYESEINFIADLGKKIDISFIPITGCGLGDRDLVQQGAIFAAKSLKASITIPMHGGDATQRYQRWVRLKERGVTGQLAYAVDRGDVMKIEKGQIVKDFQTF